MTNYVVGFAHDGENVLLIEKKRPSWQAGKLNGIGGKIEPGETTTEAMQREFKEETGLTLYNWRHFATLTSGEHQITCFTIKVFTETLVKAKTVEDEEVILCPAHWIYRAEHIPNLSWLIPLAMYEHDTYYPIPVIEK